MSTFDGIVEGETPDVTVVHLLIIRQSSPISGVSLIQVPICPANQRSRLLPEVPRAARTTGLLSQPCPQRSPAGPGVIPGPVYLLLAGNERGGYPLPQEDHALTRCSYCSALKSILIA